MRALKTIRNALTGWIASELRRWRGDFSCGQCERWERCGMPPHDDCVIKAAQIASGARRATPLSLPDPSLM